MLDPFGVVATSKLTEYWSISERNTRLVPFDGLLLWNRMLWLSIGAAVIGFYRLAVPLHPAGHERRCGAALPSDDAQPQARPVSAARRVAPDAVSGWRLLPRHGLAQLPRDGQERLLRRHRACRRAVPHRHQFDGGQLSSEPAPGR